jgi:hypothetical protein
MKGIAMFENVELIEMTDEQIEDAANAGKGKPAVYKRPIRELLAKAGEKQGNLPVSWKVIHPEATERKTVIAGMRAAIKSNPEAKERMTVKANPKDDLVTVYIRARKSA